VERKSESLSILSGLLVTLLLGWVAWRLTRWIYPMTLPFQIPGKALEYPMWAALVGLLGGFILRKFGKYEEIKPGIRTELFLKVGLILLGAGIDLKIILHAAAGAIVQTLIMITSVFMFSWWITGKLGLDEKLRAVLSSAVSICGVSAAIAAAGSVQAKKEQVTYVATLVILVALPMMVISPLIAQALHLPQAVAGAWFGGNIDTTAAVVGAGTIFGEEAQKIASIVKSTQNTLIGLVAFLLAVYFARKQAGEGIQPSPRLIWDRFPKFVLGFVLASVLYSLGWIDGGKGTAIDALKNWFFTFAFVGMGMDFSLKELNAMGIRPIIAFIIITIFNTLLALGVAWVIFGGMF
jgi:uncharacterized membrane protein YadS